jgi:DNA polymerase
VAACRPWLLAELRVVRPALVVCLGAVAAHSLLGPSVKVLEVRGEIVAGPDEHPVLVTVHPASVLRAEDRHGAFEQFVADLRPLRAYL